MLVIRLTRVGKKNSPAYRVVVADKRKAVKRKFIEIIGNYNPAINPKTLVIDKERALFWIGQGAQPSETVNNLMVRLEILPKKNLIKNVYGKPTKKKDKGKEPVKEVAAEKSEEPAETEETVESTPETNEDATEAPAEEVVADATEIQSETEEATPAEESEEK
ncbi:30S ribosomal protein S16 [Candidatus Berkelbacteria bacterium CG10_big_fil_rev_8_21_14_0_10_43_13]|uniref:Small ribosomal subunit protein bS16 n=1 Tax=Candidatus Berkelbacteria bacterium CG10_big_fil_rev_8_21_14_0_10_43_13 TaxID=1974514 RepID=A0A2H0W7G0_9BACT|nr:MAG: 30S ribosomal protein S16 [Candidatus Berkelbacteria bacterium CG10_big_fil_rev_8_21_14_0_10_43_13]